MARGEVVEVTSPSSSHSSVGVLGGELGLDLVVVDDAALRGVDEEHAAGLSRPLLTTLLGSTSSTPTSLTP